MTLTLRLTERLPGRKLLVTAEADVDAGALLAHPEKDPGGFLLNALVKLRAALDAELKRRSAEIAAAGARLTEAGLLKNPTGSSLAERRARTARLKERILNHHAQTRHD